MFGFGGGCVFSVIARSPSPSQPRRERVARLVSISIQINQSCDDSPKIEIKFVHALIGLANPGEQLHNKPTDLGSLGFIDRHGFIVTNDYELAQDNQRRQLSTSSPPRSLRGPVPF